jgi:transposase
MREWPCDRQRQDEAARRKFTDELNRDAAALVVDTDRSIAQVAREQDVYESSLGRWVAQERADRGDSNDLSSDERARSRELEGAVAVLAGRSHS